MLNYELCRDKHRSVISQWFKLGHKNASQQASTALSVTWVEGGPSNKTIFPMCSVIHLSLIHLAVVCFFILKQIPVINEDRCILSNILPFLLLVPYFNISITEIIINVIEILEVGRWVVLWRQSFHLQKASKMSASYYWRQW